MPLVSRVLESPEESMVGDSRTLELGKTEVIPAQNVESLVGINTNAQSPLKEHQE